MSLRLSHSPVLHFSVALSLGTELPEANSINQLSRETDSRCVCESDSLETVFADVCKPFCSCEDNCNVLDSTMYVMHARWVRS